MANKEFSEGSLKIMDWHAQSSADVIKTLKTNERNGLSSAEAKKDLKNMGKTACTSLKSHLYLLNL